MANITQELARIQSAVYGEEVRESIHDAIYAMNNQSEASDRIANTAHTLATEAREAAITAQDSATASAQSAQSAAQTATTKAETAQSAAQTATTKAETAQSAAEETQGYKATAENAAIAAQTSVALIQGYKITAENAALVAQAAAEDIQEALENGGGVMVDSVTDISDNVIEKTTDNGVVRTTITKVDGNDVITSKLIPTVGDVIYVKTTVIESISTGDRITTTYTTEEKEE